MPSSRRDRMNGLMTLLFRGAALALGVFLTYCETSGTYEHLMKDQGSFNYIVKAGCGVTIFTPVEPPSPVGRGVG